MLCYIWSYTVAERKNIPKQNGNPVFRIFTVVKVKLCGRLVFQSLIARARAGINMIGG